VGGGTTPGVRSPGLSHVENKKGKKKKFKPYFLFSIHGGGDPKKGKVYELSTENILSRECTDVWVRKGF